MEKMIGSQSQMNVWAVLWVQDDIIERLVQRKFFRKEFRNKQISQQTIKKKLFLLSIKLAWIFKPF